MGIDWINSAAALYWRISPGFSLCVSFSFLVLFWLIILVVSLSISKILNVVIWGSPGSITYPLVWPLADYCMEGQAWWSPDPQVVHLGRNRVEMHELRLGISYWSKGWRWDISMKECGRQMEWAKEWPVDEMEEEEKKEVKDEVKKSEEKEKRRAAWGDSPSSPIHIWSWSIFKTSRNGGSSFNHLSPSRWEESLISKMLSTYPSYYVTPESSYSILIHTPISLSNQTVHVQFNPIPPPQLPNLTYHLHPLLPFFFKPFSPFISSLT